MTMRGWGLVVCGVIALGIAPGVARAQSLD
jgi:hypothetical protein